MKEVNVSLVFVCTIELYVNIYIYTHMCVCLCV